MSGTLTNAFAADAPIIIRDWVTAICVAYPFATTGLVRGQTRDAAHRCPAPQRGGDAAQNAGLAPAPTTADSGDPVGQAVCAAAQALYAAISGLDADTAGLDSHLQHFADMQAVQDMPPEQAMGGIYFFKPLLRKHILPVALQHQLLELYLEAESRVDTLALLGFAAYTRSREKLHALRLHSLQRRHSQLIRWAGGLPEPALLPSVGTSTAEVPPCAPRC